MKIDLPERTWYDILAALKDSNFAWDNVNSRLLWNELQKQNYEVKKWVGLTLRRIVLDVIFAVIL